jgi:hypothetical protein
LAGIAGALAVSAAVVGAAAWRQHARDRNATVAMVVVGVDESVRLCAGKFPDLGPKLTADREAWRASHRDQVADAAPSDDALRDDDQWNAEVFARTMGTESARRILELADDMGNSRSYCEGVVDNVGAQLDQREPQEPTYEDAAKGYYADMIRNEALATQCTAVVPELAPTIAEAIRTWRTRDANVIRHVLAQVESQRAADPQAMAAFEGGWRKQAKRRFDEFTQYESDFCAGEFADLASGSDRAAKPEYYELLEHGPAAD